MFHNLLFLVPVILLVPVTQVQDIFICILYLSDPDRFGDLVNTSVMYNNKWVFINCCSIDDRRKSPRLLGIKTVFFKTTILKIHYGYFKSEIPCIHFVYVLRYTKQHTLKCPSPRILIFKTVVFKEILKIHYGYFKSEIFDPYILYMLHLYSTSPYPCPQTHTHVHTYTDICVHCQ